MARRVVNGSSFSEDGWPIVDQDSCRWVVVPGTDPPVHLEIQDGQPAIILGAFAADVNAYVEKLRDRDSASWTASNSVLGGYGQNNGSNHLGGTAMDLNWDGPDGKTFRYGIDEARAWPPPKNAELRKLLDFYEDVVFCGGFWSIRDWMHFQMGGDTFNNPKTQSFIDRKIRSDGFSTYRRGPIQAQPINDAVDVLVRAAGLSASWAAKVLPQVREGLTASKCTTPGRIAMWLAQVGHESDSFQATEEYNKAGRYAPYIGRTWIQITWRENYAGFSVWCHARGLIPTESYFVDNPTALAEQKWAGLGPAWYWTVARPQINGMCDNGDIVGVTRVINGGTNGLEDRRTRYNRALALGDQLLVLTSSTPTTPPTTTPPAQEDDMAQVPQDQWDRLYHLFTDPVPSQSALRMPGEGVVGNPVQLIRNIDGMLHPMLVELLARLGDPREIARLHAVADTTEAGRESDAALAATILDRIASGDPVLVTNATVQLPPVAAAVEAATPAAPVVVSQPYTIAPESTTGQLIGAAYDALAALQLSTGLPSEAKAPMEALIGVLKTYPKDET